MEPYIQTRSTELALELQRRRRSVARWIGHHDIAHWEWIAMKAAGRSGRGWAIPSTRRHLGHLLQCITCKYPNDITMTIAGGHNDIRSGTKWIGPDGWVWVDRGHFDASNLDWFQQIPEDKYKVKLYRSDNHQRNFLDCVKSRKPTITPVETAHHQPFPAPGTHRADDRPKNQMGFGRGHHRRPGASSC
jgi:hypothetical protein